jgi:hypothetical protein
MYRVVAMYTGEASDTNYALADEAFRRALELNPDLSIAHNLFTVVELETGRARQAMLRLLQRARSQLADPELFAGLVQACRFGGLERPAIAAHEHARRLEPQIRTAVCHAFLMAGDYERAIETDEEGTFFVTALSLDLMGRTGEAVARLRQTLAAGIPPLYRLFMEATLALLEENESAGLTAANDILKGWRLRDPCANFYLARSLARLKQPSAIPMFRKAVETGFHANTFFAIDPWLDSLRADTEFRALLRVAEAGHRDAADAFVAAGGEQILGPVRPD